MDSSIQKMFQEKNSKIRIDNILLDIENNDDSIRLALCNKIELVTSELLKRLNEILKNSSTKYDLKTLSELLNNNSELIKAEVFDFLDRRKDSAKEAVDDSVDISLDGIIRSLETFIIDNKKDFERKINEIIYINLESKLFEIHSFQDDSSKLEIMECLAKYDSKITFVIQSCILERTKILENRLKETYDRVAALNVRTVYLPSYKKNIS